MILYLLVLLAVWNLIVFVFYAVDKYKAQHHLWRIPEKVLLAQALLGGGTGAILAGHLCHHKTRNGISISHGMWDYWLMLDLSF